MILAAEAFFFSFFFICLKGAARARQSKADRSWPTAGSASQPHMLGIGRIKP